MKYITKPVVIDAIQWTGDNHRDMFDFLTNYEQTGCYMTSTGEHFYIDHNKYEWYDKAIQDTKEKLYKLCNGEGVE